MLLQQLLSLPSATFISKPLGGLQMHINNAGKNKQFTVRGKPDAEKQQENAAFQCLWILMLENKVNSLFSRTIFQVKSIVSADFIYQECLTAQVIKARFVTAK